MYTTRNHFRKKRIKLIEHGVLHPELLLLLRKGETALESRDSLLKTDNG